MKYNSKMPYINICKNVPTAWGVVIKSACSMDAITIGASDTSGQECKQHAHWFIDFQGVVHSEFNSFQFSSILSI